MSNLVSEKSEMSALSEASLLVREAAEPRPVGDSVKAAIRRSAQRLGFQFSRTRDIWYANARRINAEEMDALRVATKRRRDEEVARAEAVIAVERLAALRDALASTDADFNQPVVAAIDDALRAMGRDVGAVVVREE